jgi:hypothetical protein
MCFFFLNYAVFLVVFAGHSMFIGCLLLLSCT